MLKAPANFRGFFIQQKISITALTNFILLEKNENIKSSTLDRPSP
jgi:hypothetical protein